MPERNSAAADLALLEQAVRGAGTIARAFFTGSYKKWEKSKGSPVTEADLAVDQFLGEHLRAARPSYGWLSEEMEDDFTRLNSPTAFVVDPTDGTVAFMKGRPHFTICAAVVSSGLPIAGTIYNPITEECFTARLDDGAYLNGVRLRVSDQTSVEPKVATTSTPTPKRITARKEQTSQSIAKFITQRSFSKAV